MFCSNAGSASTAFQILSAESRKYFRNAMCLSGSYFSYWGMSKKNDHLDLAYKIAEDLGEPQQSLSGLIKLLTSVSAKELSKYSTVNSTRGRLEIDFAPVIES